MKASKTHEYIFVFIIITFAVTLSLSQTFLYICKTPQGAVYPLVHNYIEDYYYYIHVMRQGFDGMWKATSRLTPEVYAPQFVNVFLLLLGHISRLLRIPLAYAYTAARIIGGALLLILSYIFAWLIYPKSKAERISALILVAFGTYWWGLKEGSLRVLPLVSSWTELDPIFRISYIPHHLWSKVFFVLVLILLVRANTGKNQKLQRFITAGLAIIFTAAAGFASPVILATLVPVVFVWSVSETLINKGLKNQNLEDLYTPFAVIVSGIVTIIYHQKIMNSVFPWTSYKAWEDFMRYKINFWEYTGLFGPVLIFFVLSIPFLIKKSPETRLILIWALSGWLLVFFFARFVPLSNTRYLAGYQFIPIGIGAVWGLTYLSESIGRMLHIERNFVFLVILGCILIYSVIGIQASWEEHVGYVRTNLTNPQVYVPKEYTDAFAYLNLNTPKESVVLAPYYVSTMIPAFSSNRVICGHKLMSLAYEERLGDIDRFFSWKSATEAQGYINKYNVSYVFIDHLKNEPPEEYLNSLNAYGVYENPRVRIYKIKNQGE